jgi:hypothetical protein
MTVSLGHRFIARPVYIWPGMAGHYPIFPSIPLRKNEQTVMFSSLPVDFEKSRVQNARPLALRNT